MQNIASAIKWYLKGLFPHPLTELLLLFSLSAQYGALENYKDIMMFIFTTEYIFLPLYSIFLGLHVVRESSVTAFELSFIKGWRTVYYGKFVVLLIGYVPITIGDIGLLILFSKQDLIFPIVARIVSCIAINMCASILLSTSFALMILVSFNFLIPFSSFVVFQTLPYGQTLDYATSSFIYFTAPLTSCMNFEKMSISLNIGLFISIMLSAFLILLFGEIFRKKEVSF
jgi:hypothetical protein